jgi:hypothetical protein
MGQASKVYVVRLKESERDESVISKLAMLIAESHIFDPVKEKDSCAIKMHFGEEGNVGHVKAPYASVLCRVLAEKGALPFLSDTNTLYRGRRTTSAEHFKLATEHGFSNDVCCAGVVIPDESIKGNVTIVKIPGYHLKIAKIASLYLRADFIVGLAHFKGHVMTGFGGALKNIGMGCASREGKLAQHSDIAPVINLERCIGCMKCINVCPAGALTLRDGKAVIDPSKCIGCATCIAVCGGGAIDVDWERGGSCIQEKMVEYASAVLSGKTGACAFINFATKITKECDCLAKDDPSIVPDIGIFASADPVAVDKACYDACEKACGKDIFKEVYPQRDAFKQLRHAVKMGLGSMEYRLIEL